MHHGARDAAGGALYDNRLGANLLGDILCRQTNAAAEHVGILNAVALNIGVQRGKFTVLLRLTANGVERHDAFERIFACRRFAGQHNRAGAVVHGVGYVADFRTRRTRCGRHALEHLGGGDDIFALGNAFANQGFLNLGKLDKRNLNAHIAARDHDARRSGSRSWR